MASIALHTQLQQSLLKIPASGTGQLLGYNQRRVGVTFAGATSGMVWPTALAEGLAGGWQYTAGNPVFLNVNLHGPLVSGEWYVVGTGNAAVVVLEVLLEEGTVADVAYDARPGVMSGPGAGGAPGKCWRFAGGRWQELVNGAFPGSGNDA